MKRKAILQVLVGLLLVILLAGCREHIDDLQVATIGDIRVEHLRVKEHIGAGSQMVEAKIVSSQQIDSFQLVLHYRTDGSFLSLPMNPIKPGFVGAAIPQQAKGTLVYYFIQATGAEWQQTSLPAGAPSYCYQFSFKGAISPGLLAMHIAPMFGNIVFLSIGAIFALRLVIKGDSVTRCLYTTLVAAILFFIGGFPVGMVVEKIVFGSWWEGWPFGRDITDTKTFVVGIYWIITLVGMKGSLSSRPGIANWFKDRTFAILVIIGFFMTAGMYLIPHENLKF